ncbi:hypothetical protein CFC21_101447, partial [Triticum aestivum]
ARARARARWRSWGRGAAMTGVAHDITVAPQRLESITIRWGKVLDSVGFTYMDKDKQLHTAGPWGAPEGKRKPGPRYVRRADHPGAVGVHNSSRPGRGSVQAQGDRALHHLIKFVTNQATYGPFGHAVDSTHYSLPVLNNGSVVGMFGRAGDYLHAIGFYV